MSEGEEPTKATWLSKQKGAWVAFFTASWCRACSPVKAQLPDLLEGYGLPLTIFDADDPENDPEVLGLPDISALPTIVMGKDAEIRAVMATSNIPDIHTAILTAFPNCTDAAH